MADETMTLTEPASRITNSVIMTAIARLSMVLAIPTICALAWLYQTWQDDKLDVIRKQVTSAEIAAQTASDKAGDVSDRLIAVETKQARDTEAAARFQNEMLARQDRMQEAIVGLTSSVSALTATVQALADNQRRSRAEAPDRAPP